MNNIIVAIDIGFTISYKKNHYFVYVIRIQPGIKYFSVTVLGWRRILCTTRALFYVHRWSYPVGGVEKFETNISVLWWKIK